MQRINNFSKHLIPVLIALNIGLMLVSIVQNDWWNTLEMLGSACLMIAIAMVIAKGQINKWSALLFTITAIENGIEVANDFLSHNYAGSLWSIATIVLCVYWMRQYYVEE